MPIITRACQSYDYPILSLPWNLKVGCLDLVTGSPVGTAGQTLPFYTSRYRAVALQAVNTPDTRILQSDQLSMSGSAWGLVSPLTLVPMAISANNQNAGYTVSRG